MSSFRRSEKANTKRIMSPDGKRSGEGDPTGVSLDLVRLSKFLLVACWFGLLTGFGEVVALGIKKFLLDEFIFLGSAIVWMSPLANLLLFAVVGLFLWLLARRARNVVAERIGIFILAFLGFWSLILLFPWLHPYTALLLAAGLAVQTTLLITARCPRFYFLVRQSTGWIAGLVVALAIALPAWQTLAERRALAQLPPVSLANPPNVLLIVLDTVRAQSLSLYGYERPTTPYLERLAKRGVLFERALVTSPWTLPSHASMFTGRYPHELSADWFTPLDATYPTLAEILREHGYATAGFVGNVLYCGYETGLARGFIHYDDYVVSAEELILSSSLGRTLANDLRLRRFVGYYDVLARKTAADVNDAFLRWLSRNRERPFFAFLNYYDAHDPHIPPDAFYKAFGPGIAREKFLSRQQTTTQLRRFRRWDRHRMTPLEIQAELGAYHASIAYIDYQISLLLDELQKRKLLENTVVIITSDHGEQFGERRLFFHGNSLYLPLLHVPLLVLLPEDEAMPKKVREPVSLRDLPATVVDLVGLEQGSRFRTPGNSLRRHWNDSDTGAIAVKEPLLASVTGSSLARDWYPVKNGDLKSLVIDFYQYIRNGDGREELFDIEYDLAQANDLVHSTDSRILNEFRLNFERGFAKE